MESYSLDRKIRLAVIAEDLGLTTRKELFPDNYQDIWIELRPQTTKAKPWIINRLGP